MLWIPKGTFVHPEPSSAQKSRFHTWTKSNISFADNSVKRPKRARITGHLEPFKSSSRFCVHVIFLRTVPARGCVRGEYVYVFPCDCATLSMYGLRSHPPLNATHPCLLSSSGSGPVELEHGAQLLSASKDFILRTKQNKKTTLFQHPRTVLLSNSSVHIILLWLSKTMTKQDAGGSVFFPPNINVTATVIYIICI